MVQAVIFDLDDTLLWDKKSVKTAFEKTCAYAATKYEVDPEELEEAVREEARSLYASYETYPYTQMIGINPFEGLWGTFDDPTDMFQKMKELVPTYQKKAWIQGLAKLGIHDVLFGEELAKRFPEERKVSPFIYEETFEVLDALKGKVKLAMLTNGSPSLQQTKLTITPELVPYFDEIVISGDFGKGKPDARIFEFLLEKLGVEPQNALMVGDNLMTDILGASRVNMPSVWINREESIFNGEAKPTYEIKNLREIYDLLEEK